MRQSNFTIFGLVFSVFRGILGSLVSDLHALGLSHEVQIDSAANSNNFTQRWSTYHAPSYAVAVKPVTDEDVSKIIRYAANTSTPFLSTGGGHGFSTSFGRLRDGIELDLSNFKNVKVDTNTNVLTIGGAVRFQDVVSPLGQARKELPIGSESCVGMVGATLGGGVGRYNGLHGMLLDTLISVRLVTAAGDIIEASTVKNSDLFWGIRGAGFNYATILEAKYTIYDETSPQVLNADFLFAPNASETILQYFKTFEAGLPAKLSFVFLATYSSQLGGSLIFVNAIYAGPRDEGQSYLQPLLDASPTLSNLTMIPWSSINSASFFGFEPTNFVCPTNSPHNVYGSAVHHFDVPTFQTFYENYDNLISSNAEDLVGSVYFIEFFPKQAVVAVPRNSTAYPWRNITAHLLFTFAYKDTSGTLNTKVNELGKSARQNFTAFSGFEMPQIYVSYGHGDEDLAILYSAENLPYLRSLKKKWDPNNLYRYNHPLI